MRYQLWAIIDNSRRELSPSRGEVARGLRHREDEERCNPGVNYQVHDED